MLNVMMLISCTGIAQKQTFDVISYEVPRGWEQKQNDASVQLTATDKSSGAYVMAIITRAKPSAASAGDNFTDQWSKAIKEQVELDGEPVMQAPSKGNGWDIVTGGAGYTDNGTKGNIALLSATGNGQTVSVIVMTNSKKYEQDLSVFLNSLELSKTVQKSEASSAESSTGNNVNPSSLVGLWVDYKAEVSGYSNGVPMYSAGYFRKEYLFKENGTYVFRVKNWSATMKEILFIYETGTWKVNGNQLTIAPTGGKGEWWGKAASGRTTGWGSRIRLAAIKKETVAYNFELHYYEGVKETHLLLSSNLPTEREGSSNNGSQKNSWSYVPRKQGNSMIDNPPGFKP